MTKEERDEWNRTQRKPFHLPKGIPEKVGFIAFLFFGMALAGVAIGLLVGAATITYRWLLG